MFEPKSGPYMYNPLGSVVALAKDSFTAMEMAKAMQVEWTDSPNSSFDSQTFTSEFASAAKNPRQYTMLAMLTPCSRERVASS